MRIIGNILPIILNSKKEIMKDIFKAYWKWRNSEFPKESVGSPTTKNDKIGLGIIFGITVMVVMTMVIIL